MDLADYEPGLCSVTIRNAYNVKPVINASAFNQTLASCLRRLLHVRVIVTGIYVNVILRVTVFLNVYIYFVSYRNNGLTALGLYIYRVAQKMAPFLPRNAL